MKASTRHLLVLAAALAACAPARAETALVRTGFDYSKGDYGLPVSTEIVTIPFGVSYTVNRTTWDLDLSYLRIDGPGEVVPGIGRFLARRLLRNRKVARGVGDLTLGVTQAFATPEDGRKWSGSAGADLKLGTASAAKSLGTGKDDFGIRLDLSYEGGAVTPFATVGFRWLGKPAGSDVRDYAFGTLGLSWAWGERTSISLLADGATKTSAGGRAATNFTLSVSRSVAESWQVQVYGVLGGSDATADHGAGMSLSRSY